MTEEWIDEDKLELWEIKLYNERQEKSNVLPITRTATGKLPPARQHEIAGNNSNQQIVGNKTLALGNKASAEEIKEKMEQQLKIQRAAHHQKRALEMKTQGKIKFLKRCLCYFNFKIRFNLITSS